MKRKSEFLDMLRREGLFLTSDTNWKMAMKVFAENGGESRLVHSVRALEHARMVTRAPK